MSLYSVGRKITTVFFRVFFRIEVVGNDNIPDEGPVIVCSNHISNLDPPFIGTFIVNREVHFMAKEELFKNRFVQYILYKLHAFPVKRGLNDKQALRTALTILKEGKVLGIFPEGTRSKSGKLKKGLPGTGFFALKSEAVVVPCAIIGSYKLFRPLKLIFGEPMDMTQYRKQRISPQEVTDLIMEEIAKLIDTYK